MEARLDQQINDIKSKHERNKIDIHERREDKIRLEKERILKQKESKHKLEKDSIEAIK